MREIKRIVSAFILMFAITINCESREKSSEVSEFNWEYVIAAIAQQESRGDSLAYNPNGDCLGLLQIQKILVDECNRIQKNVRYTYEDRRSAQKSKEMFIIIQSFYNKSNDIETAIRIWNGGPKPKGEEKIKKWLDRTEKYFRSVLKNYKERI